MHINLTTGKIIDISEGESLFSALKKQGIYLISSCGGKGICGKCRVRIIDGKYKTVSTGKLAPHEVKSGIFLACQTFPLTDLTIDIPKESRLVVGDKIALSKSDNLLELFKSYNTDISLMVKNITLELPPPTLDDNISDLERLKRSLQEEDISGIRFSYYFVSTIADALRNSNWKINFGYTVDNEGVYITPIKNKKDRYGIAVDIGTTTLVVYLVNLSNGQLVDVGSTYNSQMRYGDDVINRIIYATESGGLPELREAIVSDINNLLIYFRERHNLKKEDIESVTIAGNTTMTHLFWGLNPRYIREDPYVPSINFFPRWKAGLSGLEINPASPIYTFPCVASYMGGDIVSGILSSKIYKTDEISLFMDIGTNGEIVIGNKDWLVTASCSAGPCFEGSGIRCGMRATEGAIESLHITPETYEPVYDVIGDVEPVGICGSGMIDAISEMFLSGIIDQKGKFIRDINTDRIRDGIEGPEFLISKKNGADIVLTQVDIENLLRAKAAIYAGISLLLKEVGLDLDAIKKIYIAGGFGNYINVDKAIIIGMLPDIPKDRFSFLGNTAITGAYLSLLSEELRNESEKIASKMTNLELSVSKGFMDEYLSALFLPHTDIKQFPTASRLLQKKKS